MKPVTRICYGLASVILLLGAFMHARAFVLKMGPLIDASQLPALINAQLKALWLCDSATLSAIGLAFAVLAAWPAAASRTVILLMVTVPAGTAALIYAYVGAFFAGHMLAVAVVLTLIGAFSVPRRE